ncbi:molybdopterin converting factor subunit 1 [Cellvibrio sp. OA-2007]|uniref:molybdopterin converting factor subunit 1 n=1 Tax=Cellvibrio sp. OA-2007 TaxID=529823 RepID=UPI000780B055|nr:molybdopterin converting factor subunit 1 [Cellvibrio sp. OA-2007]
MIRVLFLAQLREQLGTAELHIHNDSVVSISTLKQYLVTNHSHWEPFIANSKLLVAVNHAYAKADVSIKSGDEIAFFPPVTGG